MEARPRLCNQCEQLLIAAANARRRHSAQVTETLELRKTEIETEEVLRERRARLLASLDEAQAAWDCYRGHLVQHGILPATKAI